MSQKNNYKRILFFIAVIITTGFFTTTINPESVLAEESIEVLEEKIDEQRDKIAELDKQIEEQRQRVFQSAAEAQTIETKIAEIERSKRKIETGIQQTQAEIQKSELTIEKIGLEISDKQKRINTNTKTLAETIRTLNRLEESSLIETVLGYDNMSQFWSQLDILRTFQNTVQTIVRDLQGLQMTLEEKQVEEEEEIATLESSKRILDGERDVVAQTKETQDVLYTLAKTKEQTYQSILNDKIREREEFEAALFDFESQLQTLIDPASFPNAQNGILGWPVKNVRITQQFGGTQFAKNNPHIYGRGVHNGTDFGVPVGEHVLSVFDGVVTATGNTDAYPGCVSWGKWVLIKHTNGLSSLYAHNSSILVSPGDQVSKGDVISLSGNTGYSTGPHLHLTLYATQGVEVVKFNEFKKGSGCAATGASTPVAPLEAYLDPMEYLPSL
jgi:murein DD-endopeptidase MepM/ murein hydrolase activator NlpD